MRALIVAALLIALPAQAHEFWFEPVKYRLSEGEKIVAVAINGENFKGSEMSYSQRGYSRSGVVSASGEASLPGKTGDRPAIQVRPTGPGLNIVWHQSTANSLTYATMEKFERFLRGKHLEAALEVHRAKGMPEEKIREAYFRYAKTLVAVGNGEGADRAVGLPYELVALDNPYTHSGDIRFQVLSRGKPVPNAPAFVFHKPSPSSVEKLDFVTDAKGQFTVPRRGGGEFMVNAVEIREAEGRLKETMNAHWVTLWASLTYEL